MAFQMTPAGFGHRAFPTLEYYFDGQPGLTEGRPHVIRVARAVVPSQQAHKEWLASCLGIRHYQGMNLLGGWSPGRSAEVQVSCAFGPMVWVEYLYYRVGDDNSWDLASDHELVPEKVAQWFWVWRLFLCGGCNMLRQEGILPRLRVRAMITRELAVWDRAWLQRLSTLLCPGPTRSYFEDFDLLRRRSEDVIETYHVRQLTLPVAAPYVEDHSRVLALVVKRRFGYWRAFN